MPQILLDIPERAAAPAERRLSVLSTQLWIPLALGAVVFVIDLFTSRGIDVGVLYVIALLGAMWARPARAGYYAAAALTPLLVAGHFLSQSDATPAVITAANRAFALAMLWGVAALLVRRAYADGVARERAARLQQDVTERRRIEEQLRAGQSELQLVIDAIPALISYVDASHRYRFNNHTYELWFGYDRAEIRGRHMREVLGESAYERVLPFVERALAGETVHFETELEYKSAGRREVSVTYVPHRFGGRVVGFVVLVEDIAERSHTERARAHLAAIVESSSDAIASKTLDGTVTSWNAGAERLFGYTAEEMIGSSIMRLVPPELRAEEESILARLARGERISGLETERVRKNGKRVMISLTVSPVRDSAGRIIGASKIARDITERKRAEEHRELLVRELMHRVKNTLAVVQSIARQTGRGADSIEEFRRGFDSRLAALARAHDLLLGERWQPVELERLIGQVLRPHLSETGGRIEMSGPAVSVEAPTAISISMALHELATNAVKYGALSRSEGRVGVSWRRAGDGSPAIDMLWQERGGPPVVAPTRTGFGSRLIQGLAREFGGEISLDFAPEGVECRLRIPIGPASGVEAANS